MFFTYIMELYVTISTKINSTPTYVEGNSPVWKPSQPLLIFTTAFLCINAIASGVTNALLLCVIQHSQNFKTPPNSYLVNICCNNLTLSLCMILSAVSIYIDCNIDTLAALQIFILTNGFLQYWGTFAAIGYYRQRALCVPAMSLRIRRSLICRSIICNWIVSLLTSLMISLSFMDDALSACFTFAPFRQRFRVCADRKDIPIDQLCVSLILILVIVIYVIIIVKSYYVVFKVIRFPIKFGKNQVSPFPRLFSLPSVNEDDNMSPGCSYSIEDGQERKLSYMPALAGEATMVVHHRKDEHMLTFEDIMALENPIRASSKPNSASIKQPLQISRSTETNNFDKSKCPEFEDISSGAALQKFQAIQKHFALRNHTFKKDRVSLSSATRNSLIMLVCFVIFSLPMFVCTIPWVLAHDVPETRLLTILFSRLLFYLNASMYALWYLTFNKTVRKGLHKVYDHVLFKMNLRV